ncbi:hypothetical protein AbraIFM66951_007279 [Aspergillus brasiliensis]|uniref:Uncharacterized protein n=1 Tax=Aspergillus brasiliensis TaxID=319629 RepID=A0A9W5YSZ1_9EURO|nr:hypothetical protein AbraCBS73388_007879 [Aspergillus brasiliensis]GKZ44934.1 hypothetical protein AbraIFM66951_007279 [Aspergillus brasiliensis]
MAAPPASNFFYHTRARNQGGRFPPRPSRNNGPKPSAPFNRANNTSSNAPQRQRQPNHPPTQSGPSSNPRSQRPSGTFYPHYKSNAGISKPTSRKNNRDFDGDISMTDVYVKPQTQKRQPINPPPHTQNQPNTGRRANYNNTNINHYRKSNDGDTIMLDACPMPSSQSQKRQYNNLINTVFNTSYQNRRGTAIKSAPRRPFSRDADGDSPMFDIYDMVPTTQPIQDTTQMVPVQLATATPIYAPVDFDGDSMMLEVF